ncbi:hypothetical protein, partial [Pseudoalteromonas sp. S16_S37]|uniref:hypothetical protein n=1 Tax=Pseudoalteromonas sp. S16_S37 TaxID=2720228 RepID=UPI0016812E61
MTTELTSAVTALQNVADKHEQLNSQYQGTHDTLAANTKAMTDWQTQQGTVELTDQSGNKHATPTLKTLVEQAQSVNPHPDVMTKAQFDALRQMRKQQYAGSGFVEWGYGDSTINAVNHGMWEYQNKLNLGRSGKVGGWVGTDKSSSPFPNVLIDGVSHELQSVDYPYGIVSCNFPPAPDGTKTYDSATGIVTQHSNAEVAFASETETNKVITSRKDLVFLESWHEKIADKDVVYPLGNVQYGATSYEGIALLNNLVAQGYSAFGAWDQNTKGYGVKWSTLTDVQKAVFLGEPEHNIYFDPKANAYIQVRYRVRVVEGYGDQWNELRPSVHEITTEWAIADRQRITFAQGSSDSITTKVFVMKGHAHTVLTKQDNGVAEGEGTTMGALSHGNTKPLGIPIALVQRLNQGAYHPSYNPMGCDRWIKQDVIAGEWYTHTDFINASRSKAFFEAIQSGESGKQRAGSIGSGLTGRPDQYKYHDAIYAGQVEDLRLNANKLDVNQLREDTMHKAVSGTLRG